MEKLISIIIAVDCILQGPFTVSEEKKKLVEERLETISQMIPKSNVINDYPKVIQFRSMVEKMKDDFVGLRFMYHMDKVIGEDDNEFIVCFNNHIIVSIAHELGETNNN